MNRYGQVWLDNNDGEGLYLVVEGPIKSLVPYYMVLDLSSGRCCRWSVWPDWEKDDLLTRVV